MGAKDRIVQTATDLARGMKDATEDVSNKARTAVGGLLPGDQAAEDPGNSGPDEATSTASTPSATSTTPADTPMAPASAPEPVADLSQGNLPEIDPDPGNKAGVRDTAGDRVDHG